MKLPKAQQGNRPLYVQVRDLIVAEIQSGAWAPGAVLPSEFELARTYGGHLEKYPWIDALESDSLMTRW
ncbi:MAG TPA: GntR family transcriptional regulator, partial [Hyphomicrobiaceae bacterium]|nr:GntR family transcriptional regulator [Hyphomicrobiaceae bacterium]